MKRYIALLIVIAIAVGFYMYRFTFRPRTVVKQVLTEEQKLNLPQDWSKVEDKDVDLKFSKLVDKGIVPEVVFKKITSVDAKTPGKYVDRLVAGARSTIPTFKVVTDKRNSTENYYSAFITGTYFNKSQKVSTTQRVYIKGEDVYTITGSYSGDLDAEVEKVISAIATDKVGL